MKLIVLSLDAIGYDDIIENKNLFPNLYSIIKKGSFIEHVKTISPSLTYPIHTTILTGEYPDIHKIDHNIYFQPFKEKQEWNWYYKNIKTPTIIDKLNQNKKTTTSIFWPVTAGAKIKKCIPEIWDAKTGKTKASLILKYGTAPFIIKDALKHKNLLNGKETVALDSFTYNVFMDIIKKDKLSDLSLIHFLSVDGAKHLYGNYSIHTKNAFITLDMYIGNIYKEIEDRDDITLAILSDHTHIDTSHKIDIMEIFRQHELLFNNDYVAYPRTCDGSCYVHIKNKSQKDQIKNKIRKIVTTTKGIKAFYDLSETNHISSEADFLLDAQDGYYFNKNEKYIGQHGYHSDREKYDVFIIFAGANIKENFRIESGHIINHAKTFAKILDVEIEGSGQCIDEIFKKDIND
ncbi:MAG: alkaline phosphatase family protein [Bacilli bacterium]